MMKYKIRELVEAKKFREQRRITLEEVARDSGVHKVTISKILNVPRYRASMEVLEKFCEYFGVGVGDVIEYVPDREVVKKKPAKAKKQSGGKQN